MRSSNPFLRGNRFQSQVIGQANTGRMTIAGTLNKTLALGALIIAGATVDFIVSRSNPGIAIGAGMLSALVGLVFSIATCFKPEWAPTTAPIYALVEGVFLGAISMLLGSQSAGIVPTAIMLTLLIFVLMFGCYRLGILRATPMFVSVVSFATMGLFVTYMLSFLLSFAGIHLGIMYSPSLFSIGFSIFAAIIASMNLIIDFNFIEQGANGGMPKYMEWYGAFALTVTLVWLYLEMLRLLSKLNSR